MIERRDKPSTSGARPSRDPANALHALGEREKERAWRYLKMAGVMFVAMDVDGRVVAVNDKTVEICEETEQNLIGCDWVEQFVPDDQAAGVRRQFSAIKGTMVPSDVRQHENDIVSQSGRRRTILWNYSVDFGVSGRVDRIIKFGTDLTDQKEAERQNEELAKFPRLNPSPVFRIDANGDVLTANPPTQELMSILTGSTPEQRKTWSDLLARARGIQHPETFELSVIDRAYLINLIPDQAGGDVIFYGMDITSLKTTRAALSRALTQTINVLTTATEVRDPYTAGHQERVARIAKMIGVRMGLDPHRVEGLELASTIHDLGKIQIPAEILSKPSRLTEAEYDLVKEHPTTGANIVGGIEFEWPIVDMIIQHHERFDGSGYPDGLAGEDIMLEARIIGVADTLEAMASDRPYRPGLGIDAAVEEIRNGAGLRYDPDVARACLALVASGEIVL